MTLRTILSDLTDLLFPKHCVFCQCVLPPGEFVCRECEKEVKARDAVWRMDSCDHGKAILCLSPYGYDGKVRKSIQQFKFHGRKDYAKFYGESMAALWKEKKLQADVVTAVPMYPKHQKERGYNQAEVLAKEVGKRIGLRYQKYLIKAEERPLQHELGSKERKKNVVDVFRVINAPEIAGKKILLVDDIITTGATMKECVKELRKAGAAEVICISVAKTEFLHVENR